MLMRVGETVEIGLLLSWDAIESLEERLAPRIKESWLDMRDGPGTGGRGTDGGREGGGLGVVGVAGMCVGGLGNEPRRMGSSGRFCLDMGVGATSISLVSVIATSTSMVSCIPFKFVYPL